MTRRHCRAALSATVSYLAMLAIAPQAWGLTIDEAIELSQETGRPIFAVAGTET